jgi:hypothetical protein
MPGIRYYIILAFDMPDYDDSLAASLPKNFLNFC